MADEMDESRVSDSEQKDATPEERSAKGVDASSDDHSDSEDASEALASAQAQEGLAGAEETSASGSEPGTDAVPEENQATSAADDSDGSMPETASVNPPSGNSSAAAYPEAFAETASGANRAEPLRTEPTSARPAWTGSAGSPAAASVLDRPGLELLYDVELDATLQFGSKEMLLRDVLELGPGDVVELDRHIAEPVDLVVGDRIVARGEVVVASGNFALRVTEVATPQMRLESIRCLF